MYIVTGLRLRQLHCFFFNHSPLCLHNVACFSFSFDKVQLYSLCLSVSPSLSLFSQSCLKSLYLSWLSGLSPLEDLVGELLTQFTLPPVNCLPVKKPFGALKELVLAPIHEDSSLPYTSTGAYKLLQSIGQFLTSPLTCS